jgi:hypothetical protein
MPLFSVPTPEPPPSATQLMSMLKALERFEREWDAYQKLLDSDSAPSLPVSALLEKINQKCERVYNLLTVNFRHGKKRAREGVPEPDQTEEAPQDDNQDDDEEGGPYKRRRAAGSDDEEGDPGSDDEEGDPGLDDEGRDQAGGREPDGDDTGNRAEGDPGLDDEEGDPGSDDEGRDQAGGREPDGDDTGHRAGGMTVMLDKLHAKKAYKANRLRWVGEGARTLSLPSGARS